MPLRDVFARCCCCCCCRKEIPPGGISEFRPVKKEDMEIWNLYREHLQRKLQEQFNLPSTYKLIPVRVATQVVSGMNYFFRIKLPNSKYATACVWHTPWEPNTHGKDEQVTVHENVVKRSNTAFG